MSLLTLGVQDLPRAARFYRALGFPTNYEEGHPVAFFDTGGVILSLYPIGNLASDMGLGDANEYKVQRPDAHGVFSGITIAHNVRAREEVAEILTLAERAGARILKSAHDVFWGGHIGYFQDTEGHYWEIAWNPGFPIRKDGSLDISSYKAE